jgi:hypothetical protein
VLTQLLDMPLAINELVKRMLDTGELSLTDVGRNRVPVYRLLTTFPAVPSIVLGSEAGRSMWIVRWPGETTYELAIKRTPTSTQDEYTLGPEGRIVSDLIRAYPFVPQKRPWYTAALEADGPTWGDVYVWVRGGEGSRLACRTSSLGGPRERCRASSAPR